MLLMCLKKCLRMRIRFLKTRYPKVRLFDWFLRGLSGEMTLRGVIVQAFGLYAEIDSALDHHLFLYAEGEET